MHCQHGAAKGTSQSVASTQGQPASCSYVPARRPGHTRCHAQPPAATPSRDSLTATPVQTPQPQGAAAAAAPAPSEAPGSGPSSQQQQGQGQEAVVDQSLALFARQLEGKSFMCTQCGKCCTGDGEVWISATEAQAVAQHLNISTKRFLQLFVKKYDKYEGWHLLKTRPGSTDCIFLEGKLCRIHPVRPSQCSTYPWWPDLMSKEQWAWEKDNICEGFDHPDAPPLDVVSAAQQLKQSTRDLQLRQLSRKSAGRKNKKDGGS